MTRYRRDDAVLWRNTGREVVLLPPGAHDPMALAGAGVALWELLAVPHSLSAVATALAGRFDIPPQDALQAITPILTELTERGAVVASEE